MEQPAEEKRRNTSLLPGFAIILLGLIFLLSNLDIISIGHTWWALFFLIPISFLLTDMLQRNNGRYRWGSLIGLITCTTLMVIFLFDMDWGIIWPIFIVIGGLSVLLAGKH